MNQIPSKTKIAEFLASCKFDPRNEKEMKALSVVSDPTYLELRAQEMINEAQLSIAESKFTRHYDQCMMRAIRLLALARMMRHSQCDHGIPTTT